MSKPTKYFSINFSFEGLTKIAVKEIVEKTYVKSIDKMNKMQLKVYASEHGIEDIDDLTKKQIIAKIEEAGVA